MRKTKVVQLVQDMEIGGVERTISNIVMGIQEDDIDMEVWCLAAGGSLYDDLKEKGHAVQILGLNNYHSLFQLVKLAHKIRKEHVDIVHCHSYFANTFGRLVKVIYPGFKIITHYHTTSDHLKWWNMLLSTVLDFFVDYRVYVSRAVRASFVRWFEKGAYDVIFNGVVMPKRCPPEADNYAPLILAIGGLYKHKGHQHLVRAMKKVLMRHPRACLWIVGVGPLKDELMALIRQYGLMDQVQLWGYRDDVFHMIRKADIIVQPSLREGFGLVLAEAMSCAKPIVATKVGGIPEIVSDGLVGYLVTPGDDEALANHINELLSSPHQARRMGLKGRIYAETHLTSEKMIQKILKIYSYLQHGRAT